VLPLCHPLILDAVKVWFEIKDDVIDVFCRVTCTGKTGVEMEALVGVSTTLLAIYDLAKAVDPVIEIGTTYLMEKIGGKSGHWVHPLEENKKRTLSSEVLLPKKPLLPFTYAVITLSDRAASGEYEDQSGALLKKYAQDNFEKEMSYLVLPDEAYRLEKEVLNLSQKKCGVIFLTGGTGIGPRDITPETIEKIASKKIEGFGELQRHLGSQFTINSWLSRSGAYVVNETLVVLFPGSPKAVSEGLAAVGKLIPHALKMIHGGRHDHIS
jgi:molybdenum cofactor synthesis domain-containing protein